VKLVFWWATSCSFWPRFCVASQTRSRADCFRVAARLGGRSSVPDDQTLLIAVYPPASQAWPFVTGDGHGGVVRLRGPIARLDYRHYAGPVDLFSTCHRYLAVMVVARPTEENDRWLPFSIIRWTTLGVEFDFRRRALQCILDRAMTWIVPSRTSSSWRVIFGGSPWMCSHLGITAAPVVNLGCCPRNFRSARLCWLLGMPVFGYQPDPAATGCQPNGLHRPLGWTCGYAPIGSPGRC